MHPSIYPKYPSIYMPTKLKLSMFDCRCFFGCLFFLLIYLSIIFPITFAWFFLGFLLLLLIIHLIFIFLIFSVVCVCLPVKIFSIPNAHKQHRTVAHPAPTSSILILIPILIIIKKNISFYPPGIHLTFVGVWWWRWWWWWCERGEGGGRRFQIAKTKMC